MQVDLGVLQLLFIRADHLLGSDEQNFCIVLTLGYKGFFILPTSELKELWAQSSLC